MLDFALVLGIRRLRRRLAKAPLNRIARDVRAVRCGTLLMAIRIDRPAVAASVLIMTPDATCEYICA
jgi:hypothetical protein